MRIRFAYSAAEGSAGTTRNEDSDEEAVTPNLAWVRAFGPPLEHAFDAH